MPVTPNRFPGPLEAEEVQFEDRTADGDPIIDGAVRFVGDDFVGKTSTGVKSLTAAALPPAGDFGQVLISVDGATFEARQPITSEAGWLVNDEGHLLVVGC